MSIDSYCMRQTTEPYISQKFCLAFITVDKNNLRLLRKKKKNPSLKRKKAFHRPHIKRQARRERLKIYVSRQIFHRIDGANQKRRDNLNE